ncbi:MAG TPA: hypothetical protein VEC06_05200 [Paucimonas sp.]|nr:hypothetical protein [Paucimonas sp.]
MQDVNYRFQFDDGSAASFGVAPVGTAGDLPSWTALGFHQCPNCPLSVAAVPRCPMAASFVPLVSAFGARLSYEPVTVHVESRDRIVTKTTTVQAAVGSLMGLLAATSGCPRMDFLKPMAHFHLPFASEDETIYRVASMYLLAQYFVCRSGAEPDWQLGKLKANYQELQQVNAAMAARLREVSERDGTLNALVLLDLLAKALPYSIDDMLEDVRPAFESRQDKEIE